MLSTKITPADHGLISIKGTTYPGTIRPDNTQPNLRLKKHTTNIPTQTTGITELARLLTGKIERGNISKILISSCSVTSFEIGDLGTCME
jgi:hypothetical protein